MTWTLVVYYIKKLIPSRETDPGPLKSFICPRMNCIGYDKTYNLHIICATPANVISAFMANSHWVHQINHGKLQLFAWIIEFNLLGLMLWYRSVRLVKLNHNFDRSLVSFSHLCCSFLLFLHISPQWSDFHDIGTVYKHAALTGWLRNMVNWGPLRGAGDNHTRVYPLTFITNCHN